MINGTEATSGASQCLVYEARFSVTLFLRRVRGQVLRHHRPEQSIFTPGISIIDRTLVLRVIVESRREFGRKLLATYIDLKRESDFEKFRHRLLL